MSFKYRSKFHAFLSNSFCISSEFAVALTLITLFSIRYFIPDRKPSSDIFPSAHHPALFLIQDGITSEEFSLIFCEFVLIILFFIRYSIPEIKSSSLILSSAHQSALFLTQYGIVLSSIFCRKSGFL